MSFLLRSPLRRKILNALLDEPMAPVQIAEETEIDKSNVSTKLGELKEREMVNVVNPEDRKWRFYQITDYGRKMLEEAEERSS